MLYNQKFYKIDIKTDVEEINASIYIIFKYIYQWLYKICKYDVIIQ